MAKNKSENFKFLSFFKFGSDGNIIPFYQILFGSYVLLVNRFRDFFYIGGIYALLISLFRLLCGQSVFCSFKNFSLTSVCVYDVWLYIAGKVLILYLISVFCVRYYQAIWQNKKNSLLSVLRPQMVDIRSFLAMLCFFALNSLPGLSWYILKERVPNPDWRIELTFFGFVSLGFVIPLICLRLYSLLADVWSNNKISSVYEIWNKSRGNSFRMIFSISIWLVIFALSTSGLLRNLSYYAREASYGMVIIGDILYSVLLLLNIGFFINYCGIQKNTFNKENLNGSPKQD